MKTYEELQNKLKCMQATMALHRILKDQASEADYNLLGVVLEDKLDANYKLEFNPRIKQVVIACAYEDGMYRRILGFRLPDVFMGVTLHD